MLKARPKTSFSFFKVLALLAMACSWSAWANEAPVVEAGDDQVVIFPAPAILSGSAEDPDQAPNALSVQWTLVSGPGKVTFSNQDDVNTTATFDKTGTYVLQLRGFDGALAATDTLTIEVGPREIRTLTTRARFVARTDGRPASKFSFIMYGINTNDQKLDLRPGDIVFARVGGADFFDGVLIGEPGGPPGLDFFSMDFRGKMRTSTSGGAPFDASNSSFRGARMRYSSRNLGLLTCTVSGGTYDVADLLPVVPAPGTTATVLMPVVVGVFRKEGGEDLQIAYQSLVRVTVRATANAVSGK